MSVTFDTPYEEMRPWGKFVRYTLNEPSTVKIITVNPGQAFSLQYHNNRDEFWEILSGTGTIEVGEVKKAVAPDERYNIPRGTTHRMTAGSEAVIFLEIAVGNFDEADITRLEDNYGRT